LQRRFDEIRNSAFPLISTACEVARPKYRFFNALRKRQLLLYLTTPVEAEFIKQLVAPQ